MIISRDNLVNIKYQVDFNVTLGWNQTDFMVIRIAQQDTSRLVAQLKRSVTCFAIKFLFNLIFQELDLEIHVNTI